MMILVCAILLGVNNRCEWLSIMHEKYQGGVMNGQAGRQACMA